MNPELAPLPEPKEPDDMTDARKRRFTAATLVVILLASVSAASLVTARWLYLTGRRP